jgi:RimJ/RimL family protein N-acetyltransferase
MLDSELHFSFFAIERLDNGELIGTEVAEIPQAAVIHSEIGTVILKRHWSKGFGREAKELAMCFVFENFPVEVVTAGTLNTHSRAIAGLEAVGMDYVGKHCGRPFSNGRYAGVVHYAITREEWEQMSIRGTAVRVA